MDSKTWRRYKHFKYIIGERTMTEIQQIITNLQGKIKDSTDDLIRIEQKADSLRSLLTNDMRDLKKIVDEMSCAVKDEN